MALRIKQITDCNSGGHTNGKTVYVNVDKITAAHLSDKGDSFFWIEMDSGTKYLISTKEYTFDAFLAYWKG